jgi:UDP-N-acetylglucosamine acyltransferase
MNNIHPTSIISPKAQLGNDIKIGPFCVVEDNVILEDGVELLSHVVVSGITRIGKNTKIYSFASIGSTPQDLKYSGEESCVEIGQNNQIREYVTIQPGTTAGIMKTVVGSNNLLMVGTHIAHDVVMGDNVICANIATIGGHAIIEDHVVLGGLSAVHQFVRVGKHAMIGGVTAVVRDVAPYASVVGDRASIEGMNILGLKRRGFDKEDIFTLQKAFRKIFFTEGADLMSRVIEVEEEFKDSKLVNELVSFMKYESKRSFTTGKL